MFANSEKNAPMNNENSFRERLGETLNRIEHSQASTTRRPTSEGPWVVVATLQGQQHVRGIAQLSNTGTGIHEMQRYTDAVLASAGAQEHGAIRIGGGWCLNLETGETARIVPTNDRTF